MRRTFAERLRKREFKMNIVNRVKDLPPKERSAMIDEISTERHSIPFSKKDTVSRGTIYRWLKEFNDEPDAGVALMGKIRSDRDVFRNLSSEQEDALMVWRYENPYRTLNDLREELIENECTCIPSVPSEATIGRFLRSKRLSKKDLTRGEKPQSKIRLAFEAEYPQQIWMADTKGPDIYVQDPHDPNSSVLAKPIVIIDDNSRFLTAAKYVIVENEQAVMDLFFEAVLRFGICEIFYCDQGSPYMGKRLKRAAAIIGCRVQHPPRQDCSAKGKIEKVLRTCHERLEHEMMANKNRKPLLDEYNKYLSAYISQDYHKTVHSTTGQTPEERFFSFPAGLRRWISKDNLMLIFLPVRKASVSKVGLVRINKLKYLVSDTSLRGKKVEIRYSESDRSKVFVWHEDKYYGEAYVFTEENDFIKRQELLDRISDVSPIMLPDPASVPKYSRLERLLFKYRSEMEIMDMNEQIMFNKEKKAMVRARLLKKESGKTVKEVKNSGNLEFDELVHLLSKLLRKKFTSSERLTIHTLFSSLASVDEDIVRNSVGALLGKEIPTHDLKAYLEEIRLSSMINKNNKERKAELI